MSLKTRKELLAPVAPRYHRASKANKQRILDDASTSYHRNAITLLNKSPANEKGSLDGPQVSLTLSDVLNK